MERHLQAQFHLACKDKNLTAIENLLSLPATDGKIDIHINREYAFRRACERKHLFTVVKLLSIQHSHGEIDPRLFADLSPDLVEVPELQEAFKKHSFNETRQCLKPILAVSTNSEVKAAVNHILVEKAQHRMGSQARNQGTKP